MNDLDAPTCSVVTLNGDLPRIHLDNRVDASRDIAFASLIVVRAAACVCVWTAAELATGEALLDSSLPWHAKFEIHRISTSE